MGMGMGMDASHVMARWQGFVCGAAAGACMPTSAQHDLCS